MNREGQPDSPAETLEWLRERLELMEDNRQRDALRIHALEEQLFAARSALAIQERDRDEGTGA
jgi:hypothetical protein